jgi:hypothetical protein
MVATDRNRDPAGLQGTTRNGQRYAFREAPPVEPGGDGGEGGLRADALKTMQLFGHEYTHNSAVGHLEVTSTEFRRARWSVGGPSPPKTVATLPSTHMEATSQKGRNIKQMKTSMVKDIEKSANGANGAGLHSSTMSPCTSSHSSISLKPKTALDLDSDGPIRYPQPRTPSIDSPILVKPTKRPPGISDAELKRLLKLRRRIQALRLQIYKQRGLVDAKRDAQFEADERYMKRIRTNHVTKEQPGEMDASEFLDLENLWRLCQTARNEYGPAVDSLLAMENRLESEEAKLERIEGRLYEQFNPSRPTSPVIGPVNDLNMDTSQEEDSDDSSSQSSQEHTQTDEVNYDDYLRRLGNLDLLQERFQLLINEKAMLEEEQTKRSRVGKDLDSESRDFLARFDDILKPVGDEIEEVSHDVERLKQICMEKGLMDADGNSTQIHPFGKASPWESGEQVQTENFAEHSKPPQHQEPSGNNEMGTRDSDSHGGYGPFINLWLLHILRLSRWQILLLACWVAACVNNIDELKWQAEAIRLWEHDGAGKGTPEDAERLESYSIHYTPILRQDDYM